MTKKQYNNNVDPYLPTDDIVRDQEARKTKHNHNLEEKNNHIDKYLEDDDPREQYDELKERFGNY